MTTEILTLVDENDIECGQMEKLRVHELGLLHRAFSVFIFNQKGELLIQQRADEKYHSPGLWTNTCCSHPWFGEPLNVAVARRLFEEMGMICESNFLFSFTYRTTFENGLTEHEFDHVYSGISDELPNPDKNEVKAWKYISLGKLMTEMAMEPKNFTSWLKICLPQLVHNLNKIIIKPNIFEHHGHISI